MQMLIQQNVSAKQYNTTQHSKLISSTEKRCSIQKKANNPNGFLINPSNHDDQNTETAM